VIVIGINTVNVGWLLHFGRRFGFILGLVRFFLSFGFAADQPFKHH
jgi:hypothetical protein